MLEFRTEAVRDFLDAVHVAFPASAKTGILESHTDSLRQQPFRKTDGWQGRPLEAVVVDPKSDWPTFATSAEKLLGEDKAAVVFGCWTSVSRKHVLPVFEKYNGLLFYPVQYEGQEQSPNVVYTGATPNQQAIPAVEYLMSADGGSVKRFYLAGTDYVYPRTTNDILVNFLKSKGVAESDIIVNYTPFGHQD